MKKLSLILFSVFALWGLNTQAQVEDKSKRPSPQVIVKGEIDGTNITIDYSSPEAKGRTIYGELVPYDKIWRAGANEATTISFDKDVKIAGKKLKAGKYAFFVIPKEEGQWEIIFNSEAEQWGAYKRKPELDVLKTTAATFEIEATERLTYSIKAGMIHLDWSTTRLSFAVN
tara:strand:- start:900 stop:1415 length:516 start_codon:yes stop_codon:yes gene_type:complete